MLPYVAELDLRSRAALNRYVDASELTIGLLGSAITANVFLLGVAFQAGTIPLSAAAIERAIELNGAAVEANRAAFDWGRAWVVDPGRVEAAAGHEAPAPVNTSGLDGFATDPELVRMVAIRRAELVAYQDERTARRYLDVVGRCWVAEQAAGGDGAFTRTAAFQLHRLMAYKDEYEVARLLLDGRARLERSVGPVERVTWNLHPPALRAMGLQRKLHLGPRSRPLLVALRGMKRLRGTWADPFGRAEVRRTERQLIMAYVALLDRLLPQLAADRDECLRVAGLADMVRGYEGVKLRNVAAYRAALADAGC